MVSHEIEANHNDDAVHIDVHLLPHLHQRGVSVFRCIRVGLGYIADQSETRFARTPSWSLDETVQLVLETRHTSEFVPNILVVAKLQDHRVECLGSGRDNAKDDLFVFLLGLVGSKHAVPDHEQSTIVFVNAVRVLAMVDTVLPGSVDDVLERAKVSHHIVVQPHLVDQRELDVHGQDLRRQDECKRNREDLSNTKHSTSV